jgi:hypothetical protein
VSAKVKWFSEAVLAFEAAGKQPRFPGDPSPVEPLLEKLVNKLLGQCWESDKPAPDCGECAACRAHLTPQVQADNDRLSLELIGVMGAARSAEDTAYAESKKVQDLTNAVELLTYERNNLQKATSHAEEQAETSKAAYVQANTERGALEQHVAALTKERDALQAAHEHVTRKYLDVIVELRRLING